MESLPINSLLLNVMYLIIINYRQSMNVITYLSVAANTVK